MTLTMKRKLSVLLGFFLVCTLFFPSLCGCSSKLRKPPSSSGKTVGYAKQLVSTGTSRPYKVLGKWYQPLTNAQGFSQTGVASWYGEKFHGKQTACGEIFDMDTISAAHKTLPLGTYVRVNNLKNNKTLDLRINDRGPFVAGRVIDLSKAAAKALGVYHPGTAPVEVVVLGVAPQLASTNGTVPYQAVNYYSGNFTIQVGAFSDLNNAKKLWKKLDRLYRNVHITPYHPHSGKGRLYRVAVGRCSTLDRAEKYEETMKEKGFKDAFMVAE